MSEEMNLVGDLALILIASGVFTILSKVLKQPLILGYIVAGVLVGPHLGLFSGITDTHSVKQWSEIGIIFLLFGLGLEFSFKKLIKVGSAALITAGTNCIGMFLVGMITGTAMGWTAMESIFLGGMLSMSSTTIIIKAYNEMGLTGKPYAPLVFGILVVEDLIAVVLMVLLSTLAVSSQFSGGEMILAILKLVFFLILWFLVGIYVIPTLLNRFRQYLTDEILLLVSIGLCFMMVSIASQLGFSSALGAFVMGSILSETMEGERISHLTAPLKDLFGAVFFVSVGMMVDPSVIVEHWLPILLITIVVLIGMFIFSMTGSFLSGKGLTTATHTAMSLMQLGEFSFIIAGLGVSLGVMREFIYPVIIAVSVITTFTTPYIIKASGPMEALLRRKLPAGLLAKVDHEDVDSQPHSKAVKSEWKNLLSLYARRLILYTVLLLAITTASSLYLPDLLNLLLPKADAELKGILVAVITLAVMMPFLYGMAISGPAIKKLASKLIRENKSNSWPVLALMLLRIFIALVFCIGVIVANVKLSVTALLAVGILLLVLFFILRIHFHRFGGIEARFMQNLNQKEIEAQRVRPVASSVQAKLSAYDIHPESFALASESIYAGKRLRDIPIRSESGANIVKIQRGEKNILIPSGNEIIYPGDVLIAVGTREQLDRFLKLMSVRDSVSGNDPEFKLECILLDENSYLTGKTLRNAKLKDAGCLVISVLRGEEMISNPSPDLHFEAGDGVWLAGEADSVEWFAGAK